MSHLAQNLINLTVAVVTVWMFVTAYWNAYSRIQRAELSDGTRSLWLLVLTIPVLGLVLVFLFVPKRGDPLRP